MSAVIDCRLVLNELVVRTDADMSKEQARTLGHTVAEAVAQTLTRLQDARLDAFAAGRGPGGPLTIESLTIDLHGPEALDPSQDLISRTVLAAVQEASAR